MRSEQAAADAIQKTVEGGANLQDGLRTAAVGSQTVFANSRGNEAVSPGEITPTRELVGGLDAMVKCMHAWGALAVPYSATDDGPV